MISRTRQILEDLEAVRENLIALSDDIWLSIDHNDPEALEEGVQFKRGYNNKIAAFDALASDLSVLIQQYTSVDLAAEEQIELDDQKRNERIIRELNREEPHTIDADFAYKRPYGCILNGQGTASITTWRRLFELVCQQLLRCDRERFSALPGNPNFISHRGHHNFSHDPSHLRKASQIEDGLYAESNLSANSFRDLIRRLLVTFEISQEDLQLFLREERNAGRSEHGA